MHYHGGFHDSASRGEVIFQRFVIDVVIEISNVEARSCRLDHFTNAGGTLLGLLAAALGLLLFLRRIDETKRDRFDEFLPTGRLRLGTATASVTTTPVSAAPTISASIASIVSTVAIAVSATVAVSIAISTATAVPIVS